MNFFLIDSKNIVKEIKKNTFNIIISLIIIFISSTIYLSLPSFYSYENFDKKIQKKIAKDFKLNIKNIKGIQYSFFPKPHFIIEQSELYFYTNPDVIKRYGLELNSFVLRQPNYSFVYVISFIITFFIFIIFIYIKESAKKYLKNKND